jgi:hypothetical protein
VKRRTRLIVKCAATAVIVASVVLARLVSEDGVPHFGAGQAALFFTFAVASITLFVFVITDFDKWVDTVPPVPKRVVRRRVGRVTRSIRRVFAWALAHVRAALVWVLRGAAAMLAWLWSWIVRIAVVALGTLVWALARVGEALTVLWVRITGVGEQALVRYRGAMHWLWSRMGHGLARLGDGLTVLWAWIVGAGERALVRYRAAMQWLWPRMANRLARLGVVLTSLWARIARAGGWSLVHSGRGIRRAWLATVGRGDEPTPTPIRRWYSATVDAAFGIPPDGTSVDVFGGRSAPPHAGRREEEPVGAVSGGDAHERDR